MKNLAIVLALLFSNLCFAQVPTQIGGLTLNTDVSEFEQYIKPNTQLPIRFREYLDEVELKSFHGFKSGYLAFGNCANPNKVLRIKLKYKDSSLAYYEKLLKEYKSKLGKPDKWLGDSFHVVKAWKWTFSGDGNSVELYLQHNLSDRDQKLGTSVKLTMANMIESERECFEEKFPDFRTRSKDEDTSMPAGWDGLIPE